jgi:hypothetical protein
MAPGVAMSFKMPASQRRDSDSPSFSKPRGTCAQDGQKSRHRVGGEYTAAERRPVANPLYSQEEKRLLNGYGQCHVSANMELSVERSMN